MRRTLVGLLLMLLLAGCSHSPAESPSVTPGDQTDQQPQVAWTGSHPFLPDQDFIFSWSRSARGYESAFTEQWVRMEGRIIVAQGGRPIHQWAIGPTGVWAPDPENSEIMLRFLPPEPVDDMAWHQESAGETVWFRLRQTAGGGNDQWLLTMLNRGARYDYLFFPPNSMISMRDGSSVTVGGGSAQPLNWTERAAIVAAVPPLPTHLAPVVTADQAAFAEVLVGLPDQRRITFDVDGQSFQMVGALGSWSGSPIDVLNAQGAHLRSLSLGLVHTEVIMVGGQPRLLIDGGGGALHLRWFDQNGEQVAPSMGPDPYQTFFTRYRQLGDGRLEVVWEPGDAAGHRRVRTLRLEPSGAVALEAERWEAVDSSLRPPATPMAALEGLFFTRWYGRPDSEAKSYLANPADLAILKALPPIRPALSTDLRFATFPSPAGRDCQRERAAEPGAESWGSLNGFAVSEMYPGGASDVTLGRASFARAPDGRVLVQQLQILQTCHFAH